MSLQARSRVSSSSPIILGFEILPMGIPLTHRRLLDHHRGEALCKLRGVKQREGKGKTEIEEGG